MISPVSQQLSNATNAARSMADTDVSLVDSESVGSAERHAMIAEGAYFVAQARGLAPGNELDDWLAAEREIDQRLSDSDC